MKVLIIGSSAGAISCAENIKKGNKDIEVTVVSNDFIKPYFRPTLSHMILDDSYSDKLFFKKDDFYSSNDINLVLSKNIVKIDRDKKIVISEDGDSIQYDKLVLAVGSYNFMPPIENIDVEGVFNLKYYSDLLKINEYSKDIENITIIGGGLLGIEAAWAFKNAGKKVTILEFAPRLMIRQLSEKASEIIKKELEKSGIRVITNNSTKTIVGDNKVEKIILQSEEEIKTDLLFFSVGVRPNTDLAKESELSVDRGIVVDNNMITSDKDIYAVGDCSQINGIVPGLWTHAMQMGRAAANNILGNDNNIVLSTPVALLKALDIGVYSIGDVSVESDENIEIFEGNNYKFYSVKDGVLLGANLLGDTKLSSKISKLINTKIIRDDLLKL